MPSHGGTLTRPPTGGDGPANHVCWEATLEWCILNQRYYSQPCMSWWSHLLGGSLTDGGVHVIDGMHLGVWLQEGAAEWVCCQLGQ